MVSAPTYIMTHFRIICQRGSTSACGGVDRTRTVWNNGYSTQTGKPKNVFMQAKEAFITNKKAKMANLFEEAIKQAEFSQDLHAYIHEHYAGGFGQYFVDYEIYESIGTFNVEITEGPDMIEIADKIDITKYVECEKDEDGDPIFEVMDIEESIGNTFMEL